MTWWYGTYPSRLWCNVYLNRKFENRLDWQPSMEPSADTAALGWWCRWTGEAPLFVKKNWKLLFRNIVTITKAWLKISIIKSSYYIFYDEQVKTLFCARPVINLDWHKIIYIYHWQKRNIFIKLLVNSLLIKKN